MGESLVGKAYRSVWTGHQRDRWEQQWLKQEEDLVNQWRWHTGNNLTSNSTAAYVVSTGSTTTGTDWGNITASAPIKSKLKGGQDVAIEYDSIERVTTVHVSDRRTRTGGVLGIPMVGDLIAEDISLDGDYLLPPPAPGPRKRPATEFNRYINASDLLEEFIGFLGSEGVRQGEVMGIPVESFIQWLIIRACEEDGEDPPEDVQLQLPEPHQQPRCLGCGRFVALDAPPVHNLQCASWLFARQEVI